MTTLDKWRIGIVCVGGLVVLLCSMYVSFGHSVGLVMDYNQTGESAYAIVIMLETAFIVFSISTALNKLQGRTMKWFEWIFFGIGLVYVGWSNLHAFPLTIGGVALGLSIPLYLFIMEVTLTKVIISIYSPNVVETVEPAENILETTMKNISMEKEPTKPTENIVEAPPMENVVENKPTSPKKKSTKGNNSRVECRAYIKEWVEKYKKIPVRRDLVDDGGFTEWIAADELRKYKKEKNIA